MEIFGRKYGAASVSDQHSVLKGPQSNKHDKITANQTTNGKEKITHRS